MLIRENRRVKERRRVVHAEEDVLRWDGGTSWETQRIKVLTELEYIRQFSQKIECETICELPGSLRD